MKKLLAFVFLLFSILNIYPMNNDQRAYCKQRTSDILSFVRKLQEMPKSFGKQETQQQLKAVFFYDEKSYDPANRDQAKKNVNAIIQNLCINRQFLKTLESDLFNPSVIVNPADYQTIIQCAQKHEFNKSYRAVLETWCNKSINQEQDKLDSIAESDFNNLKSDGCNILIRTSGKLCGIGLFGLGWHCAQPCCCMFGFFICGGSLISWAWPYEVELCRRTPKEYKNGIDRSLKSLLTLKKNIAQLLEPTITMFKQKATSNIDVYFIHKDYGTFINQGE